MIRLKILKSIIVMFLMASLTAEAREKNNMTDIYFLVVNSNNIYATVLLNDVPLVDLKDGSSIMNEIPVAGWLMPGSNALKIIARAKPEVDRITAEISASIYLHDSTSDVPKPLKTVATIKFSGEDSDFEKNEESVEITFEFSGEVKAKLWSEAETLSTISEKDKSVIISLVDGLGKAIINGEIDRAIDLQSYKIMDDALIEGSTPEEIEQAIKANYTWLKGQKGIELHKYNQREIEYTFMDKNKVVKLTRDGGEEILQLESSDLFFEIPVFVSKINGVWKIVR
jgi:hypothetical protein